MNKEFVPYEESLALKELGFDEPCLAHWYNETPTNSEGQCLVYYKKPWDNQKIINGVIRDYYFAPTYSQAFRWFREKYNLQVYIDFYHKDSYFYKIKSQVGKRISNTTEDVILQGTPVFPRTYEEAELACLKKLIEIVKNN
jgi:hypothetical protein